MQRQKNIPAAVIAAVALLVVNGCLGQEEDTQTVDLGLTRAMVDEEGNPWWDPSANTSESQSAHLCKDPTFIRPCTFFPQVCNITRGTLHSSLSLMSTVGEKREVQSETDSSCGRTP